MKTRITKMIKVSFTAVLFGLCLASPMSAGIPGHSHAFGRTLAGWNEIYERWAFGGLAVPFDRNGNAVVHPNVVLFPIPNTPGDGTPGHLDVTLSTGQKFVLPLWVIFGTDYTDGTPPDPLLPLSVYRTLNITFQIDGKTVVDQTNVLQFFTEFFFNPPIPLVGFPPFNSFIWFQGISIVHQPLPPGTHTFQLDAVNTEPAFGGIFAYHNTWTVTVRPGKK